MSTRLLLGILGTPHPRTLGEAIAAAPLGQVCLLQVANLSSHGKVLDLTADEASAHQDGQSTRGSTMLVESVASHKMPGIVTDEGGHTDGLPIPPGTDRQMFATAHQKSIVANDMEEDLDPVHVELHIRAALKSIHEGPLGPLPKFIDTLKDELIHAINIQRERLIFLSIRGEYFQFNGTMKGMLLQEVVSPGEIVLRDATPRHGLLQSGQDPGLASMGVTEDGRVVTFPRASGGDHEGALRRMATNHIVQPLSGPDANQAANHIVQPLSSPAANQATIVDFEVLHGKPRLGEVLVLWRAELTEKTGRLSTGPLGELLRDSELVVPRHEVPPSKSKARSVAEHERSGVLLALASTVVAGVPYLATC